MHTTQTDVTFADGKNYIMQIIRYQFDITCFIVWHVC